MSKEKFFENNFDETFFRLGEKICFIEKNGLIRKEVEPEIFFEAEKRAKKIFSESKHEEERYVIELKIRQILGDETLNFADQITIQAAETFPKDKYLRGLLIRELSIDIPKMKLNQIEKNILEEKK